MRKVTIIGFPVEVLEPYKEGHKVNAAEADVLNQTRSQNIGNNIRDELRELVGLPEGTSKASAPQIEQFQEAVQAKVTEYDKDYTLSGGGRRQVRDPLGRITWRLAGEALMNYLRETGQQRKDFTDEQWNAERERLAAEDKPILEAAKKELAAAQALTAGVKLPS